MNSEKNSQRKCPTEEVGWWEEPESGMEKDVWGLADILWVKALVDFSSRAHCLSRFHCKTSVFLEAARICVCFAFLGPVTLTSCLRSGVILFLLEGPISKSFRGWRWWNSRKVMGSLMLLISVYTQCVSIEAERACLRMGLSYHPLNTRQNGLVLV